MKKQTFILAAFLLVAATSFVSCKKEETSAVSNLNKSHKSFYQPPKVDDMNAYLRDFKLKMQTRGNDDTMDIEEAAWHLSSVANYDFGNVVDNFSKFYYDTLYYNINVENGKVNVSDLSTLYTRASNDIDLCFQNLNLDNKYIRFIDAEISENGSVVMSVLVSYDWIDHQWYFPDPITLDSVLSIYFPEDSVYYWDTNFPSELQRVLNLLSSNPYTNDPSGRVFYTLSHTELLEHPDYVDPYGSPFISNSRIFAKVTPPHEVSFDEIWYCMDSYLEFGEHFKGTDEEIIDWTIYTYQTSGGNYLAYQKLKIRYCTPIVISGGDEPITPPINN